MFNKSKTRVENLIVSYRVNYSITFNACLRNFGEIHFEPVPKKLLP